MQPFKVLSINSLENKARLTATFDALLQRLADIDRQCGDSFPLYSLGSSNQWQLSQGGSWMGGFWAGCYWLRARRSQSAQDYAKAVAWCEKLTDKIHLDSSYRSLIFWYGAALGEIWLQNSQAKQVTTHAINALIAAYDPQLACVPLGTALGGGVKGQLTLTVDGWASLIDLLTYRNDSQHAALARQHTDTLLAACATGTGAFYSDAHYIDGHFQTTGQAGDWSRGQAWAMLGVTKAAQRWGEPYLSMAKAAAHYWLASRPQAIVLNRLSEQNALVDLSATVIASLAMLHLAELTADTENWQQAAEQGVNALIKSDYLLNGVFNGCCYTVKPQQSALVETTWGYFLLLELLDKMLTHRR
jgi:unsaturated chondroitin disaccharide hydrolase